MSSRPPRPGATARVLTAEERAAADALAAEGERIVHEAAERLADGLAAVVADAELRSALDARSLRDAVEYLRRRGRLTRAEADALLAGSGSG